MITASHLYKYSFPEQLIIYAQRPDATACAEYDIWVSRMNRYVRKGSKGIALLDEARGYPRLRYVVDVSEFAVNKLKDRGSLSITGVVTNIQDFIVNAERNLIGRDGK